VIAAVTAASSFEAAQSVAGHLAGKPYYLDVNSVSPGRKQATAQLLGDASRYIDVAIVAPIHPARHKSPMLLSGPDANAIVPLLQSLGMRLQVVGNKVGAAAAIKMVRSVMIKGLEALTLECFLAAARAGVVAEVAASLRNNYPTLDWDEMSAYNIERMASHGIRRAAEMREVAATLRELGVAPTMTEGTIARQQEMGEVGHAPQVKAALTQDRDAMLAVLSKAVGDRRQS
jgi:3-hydroxyisobutyrate dehydrogenase-like beta-hydroxyacid dehydrogenase